MTAPSADPTLYPKITNHINEIIRTLQSRLHDNETDSFQSKTVVLQPIPIIGSVKLHGTHADILIHNDDRIVLQSKNKAQLLATADNHGFASAMAERSPAIIELRNRVQARWRTLNPDQALDDTIPITIAGEWIGENIQKGVAVSQLSKRLVIISMKVNGKWVLDSDYANIEAPQGDIHNIARGGFYHFTLYPEDPQRTLRDLEPLAEQVATRCPFADSFGCVGEGEGLVWKLVPYYSDSTLWFKTKGGRFKPTFAPAPKQPAAGMEEKVAVASTAAKAWCSEERLEQGWDYLREQHIPSNMKGIGSFLKWVQLDILAEEKDYIKENDVDESVLRQTIIGIAKPWFLNKYQSG